MYLVTTLHYCQSSILHGVLMHDAKSERLKGYISIEFRSR